MSNGMHPLPSPRRSVSLSILFLAILLTSLVAGSFAGTRADSTSIGYSRSLGPLSVPGDVPPASVASGCNGTNVTFGDAWVVLDTDANTSANVSTKTVGPGPLNVSVNLSIQGPQTAYNYSVLWGDGGTLNGSLVVGANYSAVTTLVHYYSLPAIYYFEGTVSYSCGGQGGVWTSSFPLTVYGSAGPTPVDVIANVTNAPVPIDVNYTATIAGAPSNATATWTLVTPLGETLEFNQTATSLTTSTLLQNLTIAGTYTGYLGIFYPGGVLEYASVPIPNVEATPLAVLQLASTSPLGNSPWNLTFWGNVTSLSGGNYSGAGSVEWFFPNLYPNYNSSLGSSFFWTHGPTVGASVWREFVLNSTPGLAYQEVRAAFVLPNGVAVADNVINLEFWNGAVPGPALLLSVTPSWGAAPLFFNATAQINTTSNGTANYSLVLGAYLGGTLVWQNTTPGWTGSTITVPGVLNASGTYALVADAEVFVSGVWQLRLTANTTVVVIPGPTRPPALSFSVTPANGSAPLNLTLGFVAVGGTAPYNLSVCREGPFALPNGTGACTSIGTDVLWNGSSVNLAATLSVVGNYTIVANVSDSVGLNTSAIAFVAVSAPVPVAPLTAQAASTGPSSTSVGGATFGFVATIAGGLAPYTVQWSFGDGSLGSGVPGGTTLHTFTASGSYAVTLTVTDGRGVQARSTVGPLDVLLPLGPSSPAPWWSLGPVLLTAAFVGVLSAGVLAATIARLGRRREALNWFREIEERRDSLESVPRSR
jgi:hypothetical protein